MHVACRLYIRMSLHKQPNVCAGTALPRLPYATQVLCTWRSSCRLGCLTLCCIDSSLLSDSGVLCCAGATEEAGALTAVEQLPPLVLQALAHALDYLQPLKMEGVLRMGATFRPFNEAHEMSLSPNALR